MIKLIAITISILISFITSSRSLAKEGAISIDFIVATDKQYLLAPIEFGEPPQLFNAVLDLSAERTWITTSQYKNNQSKTFSTHNFPEEKEQDNFVYKGIRAADTVKLNNKSLQNFDFLLVDQIENLQDYQGVISLGREYDSKKYSLVYKMSATSSTFYNLFVLKFKDNNSGELHIGDLTDELKEMSYNNDYKHSCTLIRGNPKIKWTCKLTHIFIGDLGNKRIKDKYTQEISYIISSKSRKIKEINKPANFETIYNKIYVNNDIIDYLKENYFYEHSTKKSICKLNEEKGKKYFTCNKNEIENIKNLNFVFDSKLALSLPSKKLFDCNGDICTFVVMYDEIHKDAFVMGLPIIKNYQMIFEYNKNELTFVSKEDKAYVKLPTKKSSGFGKFFKWVFIIALICGLGYLIFIFIMRKKNEKKKMIEEQIYENY